MHANQQAIFADWLFGFKPKVSSLRDRQPVTRIFGNTWPGTASDHHRQDGNYS